MHGVLLHSKIKDEQIERRTDSTFTNHSSPRLNDPGTIENNYLKEFDVVYI